MCAKQMSQEVSGTIPELTDFRGAFPHYGAYAEGEGRVLFDTISTPLAFELAKSATLNGLPAVAGVVWLCERELQRRKVKWEWTPFRKQYLGALVKVLMKVNGVPQTHTKRAVPHEGFTKGEVYQIA